MIELEAIQWLFLAGAALCAGFFDAVVGGGGLIQLPALFVALPNNTPASVLGTNKSASIFGTASASWHYLKKINLRKELALAACLGALLTSFAGAVTSSWVPVIYFKWGALLALLVVAVMVARAPHLGQSHTQGIKNTRATQQALLIGGLIGFYDGLFGPGTGIFLIFAFVRFFGFDFLHASAYAKLINLTTNAGSLVFFLPHGHVIIAVAAVMASANFIGGQLGARWAVRYGNRGIRKVFFIVLSILLLKFAWDLLRTASI